MTITITKKEVDEASADFTRLVAAEHRQEAIAIIEALVVKFMTLYHMNPDDFFDFNRTPASEAFQTLIANVRRACPKECGSSTNEIIRFKLGDRVYGYNIDETPILFALAGSVPPGQIIIDHLNDHFRDSKDSPISKKEENHLGTSKWEESKEEVATANEFEKFYMTVPKLRELPRAKIDETYRATHGIEKEVQSINRGCKAGILKTVLEGATVHFNLDRFMEATYAQDAPDKKDKQGRREGFFTIKELRFIKRLCDTYPSLADKIKFYHKGQEVAAPWSQPELLAGWEKYKRKGEGGLEATMSEVAATKTLPTRITENARLALHAAHSALSSASAVPPVDTPLSKGEAL